MSIPPQGNAATAIVEAGTAVAGAAANTVLYVDAAGLLASEAAFGYVESSDTLTALNIVASTTLKASNLTATRIPYATTGGQFTDDSSFTFTAATDLVTVDKLTVTTGPLILSGSQFRAPDGGTSAPSYSFTNDTDTGIYSVQNNQLIIGCGNFATSFYFGPSLLKVSSAVEIGWSSGDGNASADTKFSREAAQIVAFKDGTNDYAVKVFGGASKYLHLTHNDTIAIVTDSGGSGIRLGSSGGNVGFYGTTPVALQTGVAVSAAGIHAALVNLGLITA